MFYMRISHKICVADVAWSYYVKTFLDKNSQSHCRREHNAVAIAEQEISLNCGRCSATNKKSLRVLLLAFR